MCLNEFARTAWRERKKTVRHRETKTRTGKVTPEIRRAAAAAGEDAHIEAEEEICDNCGRPMAIKRGRFGQFLACTGYPKCKTTRKIEKDGKFAASDVVPEAPCPQCGKHLVPKHGRYGPFTACSNYPKCKYVKQQTTGVSCPTCGAGELVVKNTRRGVFYGCSDYPTCKFTLKDKPIPRSCPQCDARFLVEHTIKDGRREIQCRAEVCKFKEDLPEVASGEPEKETMVPR